MISNKFRIRIVISNVLHFLRLEITSVGRYLLTVLFILFVCLARLPPGYISLLLCTHSAAIVRLLIVRNGANVKEREMYCTGTPVLVDRLLLATIIEGSFKTSDFRRSDFGVSKLQTPKKIRSYIHLNRRTGDRVDERLVTSAPAKVANGLREQMHTFIVNSGYTGTLSIPFTVG